jgi:hypothetical protein
MQESILNMHFGPYVFVFLLYSATIVFEVCLSKATHCLVVCPDHFLKTNKPRLTQWQISWLNYILEN